MQDRAEIVAGWRTELERHYWSIVKSSDPVSAQATLVELLTDLAAMDAVEALPEVAPCLRIENGHVRSIARSAVARLVRGLSWADTAAVWRSLDILDPSDRYILLAVHVLDDASFDPRRDRSSASAWVDAIAGRREGLETWPVLGWLSFHHNGYVRQEAIERLAKGPDADVLPFLLIRFNDWVEPVARLARDAVEARIVRGSAEAFLDSLGLVERLLTLQRHDGRPIAEAILDWLSRTQPNELVGRLLAGLRNRPWRQFLHEALHRPGLHRAILVREGLAETDPLVRRACVSHLEAIAEETPLEEMIARLQGDRSPTVRRAAWERYAEIAPASNVGRWPTALHDSSRSIRSLARFWLLRRGWSPTDIAAACRDASTRHPDRHAEIEALAEVATPADAETFRELASHRWPSRRAIALQTLVRLEPEASRARLLAALETEDNPQVLRVITKNLAPGLSSASLDALVTLACTASAPLARKTAVDLLATRNKWASVTALLAVVAQADAPTALAADRAIRGWLTPPRCNRDFTTLRDVDRTAIEARLPAAALRMDGSTVSLLTDALA